jgi:hypothetical protein
MHHPFEGIQTPRAENPAHEDPGLSRRSLLLRLFGAATGLFGFVAVSRAAAPPPRKPVLLTEALNEGGMSTAALGEEGGVNRPPRKGGRLTEALYEDGRRTRKEASVDRGGRRPIFRE